MGCLHWLGDEAFEVGWWVGREEDVEVCALWKTYINKEGGGRRGIKCFYLVSLL